MRRIWPIFTLLLHALPVQAALEVYFVHNDHLGTPRVITDKNQQVVWKGHMTPFGEMKVEIEEITNHRRFPGQWYDIESRLYYNYFRNYDPGLGRYVQSDPIGLRGGLNTYVYALQNPVRHSDPLGLESVGGSIYWGWGGGIYFGEDACGDFLTVQIGGGYQVSGGYYPSGTRPGGDEDCTCESGISGGLFGNAELNLPWLLGLTGGVEANAVDRLETGGDFNGGMYGTPSIGPSSGGVGVSAGAQFSFF